MGGGDLAAAQLLNQVQGTGHAKLGGVLGDTLLVMAGGIGVLAEAAGRLADVVAGELGALKQQLGGGIFNFAVQAAHDTRQRNGLGAVADDEVVGRQGEFLFVQRCDLLAVFGAADEDLAFADLYDPDTSIRFGCYYLHLCLERYNGDVATAAAAYHSGWGTVDALLQKEEHSADGITLQGFPYNQMHHYVEKITACYAVYQNLYGT